MHFLEWKRMNSIKISLKFVPKAAVNNIPELVQIMAWRRPGDKPLSEQMMLKLLTHICVIRPQWVNLCCRHPVFPMCLQMHWVHARIMEILQTKYFDLNWFELHLVEVHLLAKNKQKQCFKYRLVSRYCDVMMSSMASQITGVSIVCSGVCSGADQRKHQISASLAYVMGDHRWWVDSPHKGPATRKMFPFDDVIMWIECHDFLNNIYASSVAKTHLRTH